MRDATQTRQTIPDMNLNTNMTVNRITDEIWEIPMSEKGFFRPWILECSIS